MCYNGGIYEEKSHVFVQHVYVDEVEDSMNKDFKWLKHELIAHRGLHSKDGKVPENSRLAFSLAIEKGYAIELDVNVLGDGTVVAFHDYHLDRLCRDPRTVDDLNKDDLSSLNILNTDQTIMTIDEVLQLVDGKVPLLIELKPHGSILLLCESLMSSLKNYQGSYAIFSFHPKVVYWFKKHHPSILRGQIAETFNRDPKMPKLVKWMMKNMILNPLTKPDFISYYIHDMPRKQLTRLHNKGMTIISYAAQSQEELDFVKSHYDNAVFEYFIPKK